MDEPSLQNREEIIDALFDLIPRLRARVQADLVRDTEEVAPEWRDILELRTTKGQFNLLRVLTAHQGCTMQELAELLDVAPPTVTAMVKRLLTQGFIERTRDEQDWRVVRVATTERGQLAVSRYEEFWREHLRRLLAPLNQDELDQLHATLPILRRLSE